MTAERADEESEARGDGIRAATVFDMRKILEYGAKFHAMSRQPFHFDTAAAEKFAHILIKNADSQIFVSDTGMIGGVLTPAFCAPNWVMAVELFWWAEKDGLKLLQAFEDWAAESGAQEVRMTSLDALPRADRLLRECSFEPAEISYRKVI